MTFFHIPIPILILVLLMTVLGSVASLFLKRASARPTLAALASDKFLHTGAFLYAASAAANILALRVLDYSVVLPLTSLTYVWTQFLAAAFLREPLTPRKAAAVAAIVAGALLLARGA